MATVACEESCCQAAGRTSMESRPSDPTAHDAGTAGSVEQPCFRHAARHLAPEPASGRAAREFVQEALETWGWPGCGTEAVYELQDILLLTSELAINAAQHARSPMEVSVRYWVGDRVRVEVRDQGAGTPSLQAPATFEESGRGLALVDLLSGSWGVASSPTGKTVWFELGVE